VSNVLSCLLVDDDKSATARALRRMLLGLAARIANNRMVAGLHTPIDTSAGRMLGTVLADYLVARCTGRSSVLWGEFPGAALTADGTKLLHDGESISENEPNLMGDELDNRTNVTRTDRICTVSPTDAGIKQSEALNWLWGKAREEWGRA
jgi:hypothetical protein